MNYNASNGDNQKRVNMGFRHSFSPHLQEDVSNIGLPVKNPATSHSDDRYLQTAQPMQNTRVRRQNGKMVTANPSLNKRKGSQPLGLGDELPVFGGRSMTRYSDNLVINGIKG